MFLFGAFHRISCSRCSSVVQEVKMCNNIIYIFYINIFLVCMLPHVHKASRPRDPCFPCSTGFHVTCFGWKNRTQAIYYYKNNNHFRNWGLKVSRWHKFLKFQIRPLIVFNQREKYCSLNMQLYKLKGVKTHWFHIPLKHSTNFLLDLIEHVALC